MKILVVGSGGREHAICYKLKQSPLTSELFCAPGNGGIGELAKCVRIQADEIEKIVQFSVENEIELVVVGPEVPLSMGLVDELKKVGIKAFGPNKECAQLESSKAFAKEFLMRNDIPTARYKEYTDIESITDDIGIFGFPMVLKADGLAAGKGVVIAENEIEAKAAIKDMMSDKAFGEAGNKIVVEEFLEGIETSLLCFVDGNEIVPMVDAKDHKKIFDNDLGPNTGGMGAFSPALTMTEEEAKIVKGAILFQTLVGLRMENLDYRGVLYVGLILTEEGPKVIEYNARFGDPETEVILPRMKSDLVEVMLATVDGKLKDIDIQWDDRATVGVIMASGGYPGSYEKGKEIHGLNDVDEDVIVFHAGTKIAPCDDCIDDPTCDVKKGGWCKNGKVFTAGGRVLCVTAFGDTIEEANDKAYANVEKISFEGAQYRKDISK